MPDWPPMTRSQEDEKPAPAVPEPTSYEVANPARVVLAQQRFIAFPPDGRWQPLQPNARSGIVLLRDTRPSALPRGLHADALMLSCC